MSAGSTLTAEALALMVDPPRVELARSTTQTISTSAAIIWNDARSNEFDFWGSSSPTLIVPTVAGRYTITAMVGWASASDTTQRNIQIRLNGAGFEWVTQGAALSSGTTYQQTSGEVVVNGTADTIEIMCAEQASGSVSINTARVALRWVAPS